MEAFVLRNRKLQVGRVTIVVGAAAALALAGGTCVAQIAAVADRNVIAATAKPVAGLPTHRMFGASRAISKGRPARGSDDPLTEFKKALALPPQNISFAPFAGNATAILATSGNGLVVAREANCSLTAFNEPYTYSYTDPYGTPASETMNYEQLLHTAAGLTTTPDQFGGKCADPVTGVDARDILYVGASKSGMRMAAVVAFNVMANSNLLFTFVMQPGGALVSEKQQTLPANAVPAALLGGDVNGDGNPDIVSIGGPQGSGSGGSTVTVLLGNSDGTLTVGQTFALGTGTSDSAVLGDFNGDGKLDVVAAVGGATLSAGSNSGSLTFLPGNGDGTFGTAVSLPLTTAVEYLVAGDFNGDGKLDVASGTGAIFLGNGSGGFQQVSTPFFTATQLGLTGSAELRLTAGDFNKDGKLDLAASNPAENGNSIYIFLGNGDGTFKLGNIYASISNGAYLTATDLDGDGNLDIYSGGAHAGVFTGDEVTPYEGYALMGRGDGTFVGAPQLTGVSFNTLQNLNGDQNLDFVGISAQNVTDTAPQTYTTYYGNGDGTFTAAGTPLTVTGFSYNGMQFTAQAGSDYVVADLNGDGKPDLYTTTYGTQTNVTIGLPEQITGFLTALGTGNGSFGTPTFTPVPSLVPAGQTQNGAEVSNMLGATNQDGKYEIVYSFATSYNTTTQGVSLSGFATQVSNGDGTFAAPAVTVTSTTGSSLTTTFAFTDLNGDKIPDLVNYVATGTTGAIQVMLGNADGTFATAVTVPVIPNPPYASGADLPIAVGDVNGDGIPDIVAVGGGVFGVALGKGDGTFTVLPPVSLASNLSATSGLPAIGDFNGDGKADLALVGGLNGIFIGNGDGTFQSTAPASGTGVLPSLAIELVSEYSATSAAGAFDLSGSGKMDLVGGNTFFVQTAAAVTPPPLVSTSTALQASASSITAGTSVTFTATVTPASGSTTPTGTVTFMSGSTTLGTGTLNGSGVATYATSSLAVGTQSITAVYGGDSNFSGSTSSAVTVTVTAATPPSFSIAASPTSGSVSAGGSAQTTITVTPAGGFNQQVSFACSGLPSGGTCSFSPTTVTPNGTAAATTTVTIATATASSSVSFPQRGPSPARGAATLAMLAGGLLGMAGVRRKNALRGLLPLVVLLLLSACALVFGCGGSGSSGSGGGGGGGGGGSTTPQSYTVTITATAGSATQTAQYALTVQ
jgi:hypothetical protein